MKCLIQLFVSCAIVCVLSLPAYAQSTTLDIGVPIEAELDGTVPHLYSWSALESTIVSIVATPLTDDLDTMLRVLDSSGTVIVENDDFNYPSDTSSIIQTFVAPRTDTFIIEVSSFNGTSGAYEVSIQRGYDRLIISDNLVARSNWSIGQNRVFSTTPVSDRLFVEADGISVTGTLLANHFPQHADFYYEASFSEITASSNWQVGIIFRHISPTSYYRLVVNNQGFWQLERVDGNDVLVVQSWSTHPAIVPGVPEFTLGVLTSNNLMNVVYNGQLVGTVYDNAIMEAGAVGVTSITANAFDSRVAFMLDSAQLTIPTLANNTLQFPEILIGRNLTAYTDQLERQQVIPVSGEIRLTSPQTIIRDVDPGVSRFDAASGIMFGEFVLGATLRSSVISEGIGGCGITFDETQDNHYTLAYVNTAGEYGVSRREGDTFADGIYGNTQMADAESHEIVVVVLQDTLYLYIDRLHVGTMPYTNLMGEIGTAVVNFDGVDTTCTIDDLWLWSLDEPTS